MAGILWEMAFLKRRWGCPLAEIATKPWLRAAQAGKILGKSACTITRWVNRGIIPRHALRRVGSQHMISAKWCTGAA